MSNFFTNPVGRAAVAVNELFVRRTGGGGQIFFTNSGAESNECAIKLARKHGGRGRHTVVSALGSFHGRTLATLAATGQPTKHEPFQPMPEGFRTLRGATSRRCAAVDGSVAAVLIEPIQGEGGVHPATTEYLHAVREVCDEVGALMMIDEIQTGFGRTGRLVRIRGLRCEPDVVTLAKAMGNGMPVGACWARARCRRGVRTGRSRQHLLGYGDRNGGVVATIDEMRRIDAPRWRSVRARLTDALRLDGVVDVRAAACSWRRAR